MIWVDAQISPAIAKWISAEVGHPAVGAGPCVAQRQRWAAYESCDRQAYLQRIRGHYQGERI
jgi:hypothetical protein